MLQSMESQRVRHDWATEQQQYNPHPSSTPRPAPAAPDVLDLFQSLPSLVPGEALGLLGAEPRVSMHSQAPLGAASLPITAVWPSLPWTEGRTPAQRPCRALTPSCSIDLEVSPPGGCSLTWPSSRRAQPSGLGLSVWKPISLPWWSGCRQGG